jgi:hypothetical protein
VSIKKGAGFLKNPHGIFISAGLTSLILLNLKWCGIYDEGCENIKKNLAILLKLKF